MSNCWPLRDFKSETTTLRDTGLYTVFAWLAEAGRYRFSADSLQAFLFRPLDSSHDEHDDDNQDDEHDHGRA